MLDRARKPVPVRCLLCLVQGYYSPWVIYGAGMQRLSIGLLLLVGFLNSSFAVTHYVWTNSPSPTSPYTNWETAAHGIQEAVDVSSDDELVLVTNGTYMLSAQIELTNGIALRSVNGAGVTVVDGNNTNRCFFLSHSNAVVDGFTVTRGRHEVGVGEFSYGGGVLIVAGGTLMNSVLYSNVAVRRTEYYNTEGGVFGGGVALDGGGAVIGCRIFGNYVEGGYNGMGGGIYVLNDGLIRNCSLYGNSAVYGGGIFCDAGGEVQNCSLALNSGFRGGGLYCRDGGAIQNSIIYSNRSDYSSNYYNSATGSTYVACCSTPEIEGIDNISSNPAFADVASGDLRLLPISPCIDHGSNETWMAGCSDLAGRERVVNILVDMGAYEFGPLTSFFTVNQGEGFPETAFVFASHVGGTNTSGLYYEWDLNGDGSSDLAGMGLATVTNIYGVCSNYTVGLTVSNTAGEVSTWVDKRCLRIGPEYAYVSLGGTPAWPFTNWATAATNIQAAVNAGVMGTTILLTNGTHLLQRSVLVSNGVRICGADRSKPTVIDGNDAVRCFLLSHPNAVLDGLIITRGRSSDGAAIRCNWFGTVRNCLIVSNVAGCGGGVCLQDGGTIENCTICRNLANDPVGSGGVWCWYGGTIRNCVIYDNTAQQYSNCANSGAGMIYSYSCTAPLADGVGNIGSNPQFVGLRSNNYHLLPSSPCIDAGTNAEWMSTDSDLDGYSRAFNGFPDMGAYEIGEGPLVCCFSVSRQEGFSPHSCVFTSFVGGAFSGDLYYSWDFNNDGLPDAEGVGLAIVTNSYYEFGAYDVFLRVTNAVGGETAWTEPHFIRVGPRIVYISTNGLHAPPFTNWANAATNFQPALDLCVEGSVALVTNGIYEPGSQVMITNGVTVQSVNGSDGTRVDMGGRGRAFYLQHPAAKLIGFSIASGFDMSGLGGAGIYCRGATIRNCEVAYCSLYNGHGGGISATEGSVVENCRIHDNSIHDRRGGGVNLEDSVLRNSLIYANYVSCGEAGGVYCSSGDVINCTITGNNVDCYESFCCGNGGGLSAVNSSRIVNSVIYGNHAISNDNVLAESSTLFSHCCADVLLPGTNNIAGNALFVQPASNDYRVLPGSPCIDAGTNDDWMSGASDIGGDDRIIGGCVDIGAFEYGPLVGFFSGPVYGFPSSNLVFTATVGGTNTTDVYYRWDFDNDGVIDQQGFDKAVVTNAYPECGIYDIVLSVSNAAGEVSLWARPESLSIGPPVVYVSLGAAHVSPYTNWLSAATDIQSAINVAVDGTVILVSNGVYSLTQTLLLTNGATLRAIPERGPTVLYGNSAVRCLEVLDSNAVVDGFVITGGLAGQGGGAYCSGGVIQNCTIVSNTASGGGGTAGGGVYCAVGVLRNCIIGDNGVFSYSYYSGPGYGGGVFCGARGKVLNCLVFGNDVHTEAHWGGGGTDMMGGGIYCASNGDVESCTIVGNSARGTYYASRGGGVFVENGGFLRNSVVWSNYSAVESNVYCDGPAGSCSYTLSDPLLPGDGNLTGDPLFTDSSIRDFRLLPASPCVDSGSNAAWMTAALDLSGHARIFNGRVDVGAYEFGALDVQMSSSRSEIYPGQECVFAARVSGVNTSMVWLAWDLNGDGTVDVEGWNLTTVTGRYDQANLYSVVLLASNASGENVDLTATNILKVGASVAYVSPSGSHIRPFTNWQTAATSIQDAVNMCMDGSIVFVSNGTYELAAQIALTNAIQLLSISGARETIVDGMDRCRCLYISNVEARISGFTLRGGYSSKGAGVYCGGGVVQDCSIVSNKTDDWDGYTTSGGGVHLFQSGEVFRCTIRGNIARTYNNSSPAGGVLCEMGGRVRNCLIIDNQAYATGYALRGAAGGIFCWRGGVIESCTVTRNRGERDCCEGAAGGICCHEGGVVRNSIIRYNTGKDCQDWYDFNNPGGGYHSDYYNCCTAPQPSGSGNISADPEFQDLVEGDFRLAPGSPCIDSGTNDDWMQSSQDIYGRDRILNGDVDMGACEFDSADLLCNFLADRREGLPGSNFVYNSVISGADPLSLYYQWDLDDDHSFDYEGLGCTVATSSYANPGFVSVMLQVSNLTGEVRSFRKDAYLKIGPDIAYVYYGGGQIFPYTNWDMAATNIQAAVDACVDGSVVEVYDGTYKLKQEIVVSNATTVRGTFEAFRAVIDGNHVTRCFRLCHTNATLRNLQITGGWNPIGGGVYCDQGGIVEGCDINNSGYYVVISSENVFGGGVYCDRGGVLRNCRIFNNYVQKQYPVYDNALGGGVFFNQGGSAVDCLIHGNLASSGGGGVFFSYGGVAVNCTIVGNTTSNYYANDGGGISFAGGGSIQNCIVYSNLSDGARNWFNAGTCIVSSCTAPMPGGTENTTNSPCFVNCAGRDYRLTSNSPCIDLGINQDWMWTATDFGGNPRIAHGVVDVGAFEYTGGGAGPDCDSDGLNNADERILYGTDPTREDTDSDHQSDRDETLAGTDPLSSSSFLGLDSLIPSGSGRFLIWRTVFGKSYWVQRCTNLNVGAWSNLWNWPISELNEYPEGTESFYDIGVASSNAATYYYRVLLDQ